MGVAGVASRQGGVDLFQLRCDPLPVGYGLCEAGGDAAYRLAQGKVCADHQQGAARAGCLKAGELHGRTAAERRKCLTTGARLALSGHVFKHNFPGVIQRVESLQPQ